MQPDSHSIFYDVYNQRDAERVMRPIRDDLDMIPSQKDEILCQYQFPRLSAAQCLNAFTNSYSEEFDGGGLVVEHKVDHMPVPASEYLNHIAFPKLCMEETPEDAIAWGRREYSPKNFHGSFGNTYFPYLNINDIAKTYANLSKEIAHQDVYLSTGSFDYAPDGTLDEVQNEVLDEIKKEFLSVGISNVQRMPITYEEDDRIREIARFNGDSIEMKVKTVDKDPLKHFQHTIEKALRNASERGISKKDIEKSLHQAMKKTFDSVRSR